MLDAYIIERIRKEREANRERGALVPLRIETPRHEPKPPAEEEDAERDRGSVVIDFQL
jgi:hypothetical protein